MKSVRMPSTAFERVLGEVQDEGTNGIDLVCKALRGNGVRAENIEGKV
jgi:hypothetical protein